MEPTQEPRRERFNVSRWALEHAPLTRYLMVVLMVLGLFAYFQLGQDEDPPFTFKIMTVRTGWPGATAREVEQQVTEKIETKRKHMQSFVDRFGAKIQIDACGRSISSSCRLSAQIKIEIHRRCGIVTE